jgi:hypothetical protein
MNEQSRNNPNQSDNNPLNTVPRFAEDDTPPTFRDVDEGTHVGFADAESQAELPIERHARHDPHNPAHIDLTQDEYTPDEVARIASTTLDVVMHAIWSGDLKAERQGRNIICIKHEDVTDWLRRRMAL